MKRRSLLKLTGAGLLAATTLTSLTAQALTPKQPEGPFYPVQDQLDKDSDLINIQGSNQTALGQVIIVEGVVTNQRNELVAGALVEIWQACESGKYDHPSDPNTAPLDPNFQYWGKSVTNAEGKYKFRTIVPGEYLADANINWVRPPHIHFKISKKGYIELITQMYFFGNELNDKDLILKRLPKAQQNELIVKLENKATEQHPVGKFNIQIEKLT